MLEVATAIAQRQARLNVLVEQMRLIEEAGRSGSLPPQLDASFDRLVEEAEWHRAAIQRAHGRARQVEAFRSGNFDGEGVNEEMTGFETPLDWRL